MYLYPSLESLGESVFIGRLEIEGHYSDSS
jgi:hypothetical protein